MALPLHSSPASQGKCLPACLLALCILYLSSCASPSPFGKDVSAYPAPGQKDICPDTHLVLTFPEGTSLQVASSGTVKVYDITPGKGRGKCIDTLDLSLPSGPTNSRTYPPQCDYTRVPYDYSRDFVPTNRSTTAGTPSGTAERTPRDMQLTIIGGFTDGFHFHPVIVNGNRATIYLHNNVLEYGHKYSVALEGGIIMYRDGVVKKTSPAVAKGKWTFSTRKEGPGDPLSLVVDSSGEGDFCTLQGALDYVEDFKEESTLIHVKAGDYEEIVYARNKTNLIIEGEGSDRTRVHYANNEVFNPHPLTVKTNERKGTFPQRRQAVGLDNCSDIVIRDIAFATDLKGQAEGLLLNCERAALYRVLIQGSGDALQANGSIYMQDCTIEGDGDTILGRGALFGYRCTVRNSGGPLSWVRNFDPAHGDVFVESHFEGKEGSPADWGRSQFNHGSVYPDAEFVVIDCTVSQFNPIGWSEIGEKTARMWEVGTRDKATGKPVDTSRRHPNSRRLDPVRDASIIASYRDPAFVLGGWKPADCPL